MSGSGVMSGSGRGGRRLWLSALCVLACVSGLAGCGAKKSGPGVEVARIEGAGPGVKNGPQVLAEAPPLPPPPPVGAPPSLSFPLMAAGAEPPWVAEVSADHITIRRTGLRAFEARIAAPVIEGQATVIRSAESGAPAKLEVFTQTCEGGDAENLQTFPYTARLTVDDFVFEGCAWNKNADAAAAEASDDSEAADAPGSVGWARELEPMIAALELCAARAATQPAQIIHARRDGEGAVSARVRDGSGERFDCLVPAGGGAVVNFVPVAPRDHLPNEEEPVFTPKGGAPPRGRCNQNYEQKNKAGAVLGFLTFSRC